MKTSFEYFDTNNGIRLLRIPAFEKAGSVKAFFTTRIGGVSNKPFTTLNLGYHVGDNQKYVIENKKRVCQAVGWDLEDTIAGKQVHGDTIAVVGKSDKGKGALDYESSIKETDALITNEPGVVLSSFYADCVPIFIFDPVKKVVGVAHAGWKGTLQSIGVKTIQKMTKVFNTQSVDCLVAIGPSIGLCCYEVDSKLFNKFREVHSWTEKVFHPQANEKWKLDLWEANCIQMLSAGVREENLSIARICTNCNNEIFFSYRKENGNTGRMGAFISLEK